MSLKSLQEKIGVGADGAFGPGTMKKAMEFYKLTPVRAAHFFAQTAHETGGFKAFSENLNYSAQGLQGIFGKYFPGNLEESYEMEEGTEEMEEAETEVDEELDLEALLRELEGEDITEGEEDLINNRGGAGNLPKQQDMIEEEDEEEMGEEGEEMGEEEISIEDMFED